MSLMAFTKLKLVASGKPVHICSREIDDDVICTVKFSLSSCKTCSQEENNTV